MDKEISEYFCINLECPINDNFESNANVTIEQKPLWNNFHVSYWKMKSKKVTLLDKWPVYDSNFIKIKFYKKK